MLFNGQYYSQTGDYVANYTNIQGCDSVVTLHLIVEQITNSISINPSNGLELMSATLSGLTYQWINCTTNSVLPGANGSSLIVSQNGTYALISTNANGCSDTSNCITISNIGLNELSAAPFSVIPNPVVSEFTLSFANDFSGTIRITDMGGKLIKTLVVEQQKEIHTEIQAPQGVYFVNAEDQQGIKTVRLIKL